MSILIRLSVLPESPSLLCEFVEHGELLCGHSINFGPQTGLPVRDSGYAALGEHYPYVPLYQLDKMLIQFRSRALISNICEGAALRCSPPALKCRTD